MDEHSACFRNPWNEDEWSLGAIKNVLDLAERTGHLRKGHGLELEEHIAKAKQGSSSMQMIDILKQIDERKKYTNKVNLEILKRMQDKETADLTHVDVLAKRAKEVDELNGHLQRLVSSKDHIITKLQQPYVGDFIRIEAAYKKYASEVFPLLVPILSDLSHQLDDIEWCSQVDIAGGELGTALAEIDSSLGSLQSTFYGLKQVREATQQLHTQRSYSSVPEL